jgi:hypothetical protein
MKNSEIWKSYDNFTLDLSNNVRKLAFAAAAIAWLFKDDQYNFPQLVKWSLFFTILFFIFDILQYFLGAIVLKHWVEKEETKMHEETGSIDGEYEKPRYVDYPPYYCWWLKVLMLLTSYFCLGLHLFMK